MNVRKQPDPGPVLDQTFDTLSHPYRRRILTLLHESARASTSALPARVANAGEPVERVEIALHHGHLPKLESVGFIDWDHAAEEVRRGPCFDEIAPFLELVMENPETLPAEWP